MPDPARAGWALVVDGEVAQAASALPPIFGSVTGFDLADDATAIANGWLPLWEVRPAPGVGEVLDGPAIEVTADRVTATYTARAATADETASALAAAQGPKLFAIAMEYQQRVAAGWPYTPEGAPQPVIIDIDADGRANLSGLALSALLAIQNVAPWQLGKGWVSRGGVRIPFETPQPALPFALGAAAYYSALVQHEQDLCDAVKAAADPTAVAAIDVTAGWPT